MCKKIDEFLKVQNEKNRVASNVFKKLDTLGYKEDFLEQCREIASIEQIILKLNPSSPRAITTICSLLSAYAKFLNDDHAVQTIQSIQRNDLWKKAKPNAPKKYISHQLYLEAVDTIGKYEELNALYYQALFKVIYEGVYCDDMSVIANLRYSDIEGNVAKLYTDSNDSYKIELSDSLVNDLQELSESDEWERKNRFGVFKVKASGRYPDSCFKVESRKDGSNTTYRFGYYTRLRRIAKKYLEYNLVPLQLFISGIMYRICLKLNENNISLEDAFSNENRDKKVSNIIAKELSRCNHKIPVRAFREQVIGHLDIFRI